ncbi:hypothetical protein CGCVW01_v013948 [Colletotrichum viniferum]|nr:hypothetical protein CGCVW01_v013948 [Colletotrichum viniferum]
MNNIQVGGSNIGSWTWRMEKRDIDMCLLTKGILEFQLPDVPEICYDEDLLLSPQA